MSQPAPASMEAMGDKRPFEAALKSEVNRTLLALNTEFRDIDRDLADVPEAVAGIKYDKRLSAEEKEARIEKIYADKNELLGDIYKAAEQEINEAEAKLGREARDAP